MQTLFNSIENQIKKLKNRYLVTDIGPYIWSIGPKSASGQKNTTIGAAIHGQEVYGLQVLYKLLTWIDIDLLQLNKNIGIFIGNPEAVLHKTRYMDRDLNRSFGTSDVALREDRRAKEIEKLLDHTDRFLDLHQTSMPSLRPFFIFPYSESSMTLAKSLHENLAIVTRRQGLGFSQQGLCSDEYVQRQGGCGLTLEAGKCGFDPYQISLGLDIAIEAIYSEKEKTSSERKIYFFDESFIYPSSEFRLKEGFSNFQPIQKNDLLGFEQEKPFLSEKNGWMLFPKYPAQKSEKPFLFIERAS